MAAAVRAGGMAVGMQAARKGGHVAVAAWGVASVAEEPWAEEAWAVGAQAGQLEAARVAGRAVVVAQRGERMAASTAKAAVAKAAATSVAAWGAGKAALAEAVAAVRVVSKVEERMGVMQAAAAKAAEKWAVKLAA